MITLIVGCMFSSKTTTLLSYERKYVKHNVLVVKHSIDTRYTSDNKIVNHDGTQCLSKSVIVCSNLMEIANETENYDCVLIDEGQFFNDLKQFCERFGNSKKIVIAGLLSDYKCEGFKPIIDVLPMADRVIHLTAFCSLCGEDAPFTTRIVKNENQTLVGTSDIYEPRCRTCHTIPN
jgi:thymidine kinase